MDVNSCYDLVPYIKVHVFFFSVFLLTVIAADSFYNTTFLSHVGPD